MEIDYFGESKGNIMGDSVRVRFAPSPTGYLHVGGARTALFNYFFAKHHGGSFLLRIEDTDRSRYQEDALNEIFEGLEWLGMKPDEGPRIGGNYGPYFQSERLDLYKKYANKLIESGNAYRCFCSSERLIQLREKQDKEKASRIGYDKACRSLTEKEIKENLDAEKPYVVRLKVPDDEIISFNDMIRGHIEYSSNELDDMVLLKTDGFPTYHLANVIDDHFMKISHVLRGDEWITSTPKHVLLYKAFDWRPPEFAHLPVILSPGGGKLSKRKGAASVTDYKNGGYLPEALVNFLALLGWAPGDDREKMSITEIIEAFDIDRVSPKSSVLDEKKLEWMNGLYMSEIPVDDIIDNVRKSLMKKGIDNINDNYLRSVLELMKNRSKKLTDLADNIIYYFKDPEAYEEKSVKKRWKGDALKIMSELNVELAAASDFSEKGLEDIFQKYIDKTGYSAGKLIHPVRLAVSGVGFGAGLFEMLELIGKERVVARIEKAIKWLNTREK